MEQLYALILAAGEGKRMHSTLPKVLHSICGKPMLAYILSSAVELTSEVAIIVGHGASHVRKNFGEQWSYLLQKEQFGTGHAVLQSFNYLPDRGMVLILCGDTPLLTADHLRPLVTACLRSKAAVGTTVLDNPGGYGRIVRDQNGAVKAIVEDRDADETTKKIKEINTGTYCLDIELLKKYLPLLKSENSQGEYYLTDLIEMIYRAGFSVEACTFADSRFGLGINNREQLAEAAALMRQRINRRIMISGVTIEDPLSAYIDSDVKIGRDTVIMPNCKLSGDTSVGNNCTIGPGVYLENTTVGDDAVVYYAVARNTDIADGEIFGPFRELAGTGAEKEFSGLTDGPAGNKSVQGEEI